jgi:hypothetical protein
MELSGLLKLLTPPFSRSTLWAGGVLQESFTKDAAWSINFGLVL